MRSKSSRHTWRGDFVALGMIQNSSCFTSKKSDLSIAWINSDRYLFFGFPIPNVIFIPDLKIFRNFRNSRICEPLLWGPDLCPEVERKLL